MAKQDEQGCAGGETLIFSCSGAADVGAVADRAARKLDDETDMAMSCTSGIAGGVEPILQRAARADTIIALDGCGEDCVSQTLEQAGLQRIVRIRVTDFGLAKGENPPTDENVEIVVNKIKEKMRVGRAK